MDVHQLTMRRGTILAEAEDLLLESPVTRFLQQKLKLPSYTYMTEMILEYSLCFYLFPQNVNQNWIKMMLRPALYQGREEILYDLCQSLPESMPITLNNLVEHWKIVVTLLANLCDITDETMETLQKEPSRIFRSKKTWSFTQYNAIQDPHSLPEDWDDDRHPLVIKAIPYYRSSMIPIQNTPIGIILSLLTANIRFNVLVAKTEKIFDWIEILFILMKPTYATLEDFEVAAPQIIPLREDWLPLILYYVRHSL